jgi:uroporphyrinogen decarboxylase
MGPGDAAEPLLLRAARGEKVESVPVWMMRQAGRHMQVYRDLCKKHKTFRERSENADVATEISLQPWRKYGTDGCILFSDILTPFPGMGVDFDITEKEGPKMNTWTTMADVERIKLMDPHKVRLLDDPLVHLRGMCVHKRIVHKRHIMSCNAPATYPLLRHYSRALLATLQSTPFVAQALKNLRHEVGNKATVLGFVGLPYTLATYMVRPEKPLKAILFGALSPPRTATSHRGYPTRPLFVLCVVLCAGGGWVVERVQGDQGLVLPAAAGALPPSPTASTSAHTH